ncbi:MAG: EsaB/YukD family protein [Bifidobacteriaceae bacterium]|jgi:type VII secretion integral membrane protein EccD|nr:EsaB/YukD family protein [Bifidobacteriaceae bacterium]
MPSAIHGATAGALVRISVTAGDKRLDIGVPADAPVVEVLPGFARYLGRLDASTVHGGFSLVRPDGSTLDPALTFAAQDVADGDTMALLAGIDAVPAKVYDDIVEAVGDSVADRHSGWSARDSANTAVGAVVALVAAGAITLLLDPSPSALSAVIAASGALLLLTAAAVAARLDHLGAGQAFAITAAALGALGGYLAARLASPDWALPAAAAAMALAGLAGVAALPTRREACLAPTLAGLVLGAAAVVLRATEAPPAAVLAITAALAGTLGNAIPWLALSSVRLKAVAPLTESEITAPAEPVDPADIRRKYDAGDRLALTLRLATAAVVLVCVPSVAPAGLAGLALCLLLFTGMMLGSRQSSSRPDVLTVLTASVLGLAATAYFASAAHPPWRLPLAIALGVGAAATAALSVLGGRPGARLGRLADALDLLALVALLPLAVVVAGLI